MENLEGKTHLSKRVVQRRKKTSPLLRVCVSLGFALFWIYPGLLYLSWIYSIRWTFQKKLPEEKAYKYPDIELSYYDFTTHFFPQIFIKHLHMPDPEPDPGLWTRSTHNP